MTTNRFAHVPTIAWEKWESPVKRILRKKKRKSVYDSGPVVVEATNALHYDSAINLDPEMRWMVGHANFRITRPILEVIGNSEGVEFLDPKQITPYSVKVAPGKLFTSEFVRTTINKNVMEYLNEQAKADEKPA